MRATTAQVTVERRSDICFIWRLVALQERGSTHNHPVCAVAALRYLRIDKCSLERVRLFRGAEPLKRHDLFSLRIGDRGLARPRRGAIDDDRAGTALAKSAAELGSGQSELT